jgi:hypothetical protein
MKPTRAGLYRLLRVAGQQRRIQAARHLEAGDTQEKRIVLTEPNLSAATVMAILEEGYLATIAHPRAGLGSVIDELPNEQA